MTGDEEGAEQSVFHDDAMARSEATKNCGKMKTDPASSPLGGLGLRVDVLVFLLLKLLIDDPVRDGQQPLMEFLKAWSVLSSNLLCDAMVLKNLFYKKPYFLDLQFSRHDGIALSLELRL